MNREDTADLRSICTELIRSGLERLDEMMALQQSLSKSNSEVERLQYLLMKVNAENSMGANKKITQSSDLKEDDHGLDTGRHSVADQAVLYDGSEALQSELSLSRAEVERLREEVRQLKSELDQAADQAILHDGLEALQSELSMSRAEADRFPPESNILADFTNRVNYGRRFGRAPLEFSVSEFGGSQGPEYFEGEGVENLIPPGPEVHGEAAVKGESFGRATIEITDYDNDSSNPIENIQRLESELAALRVSSLRVDRSVEEQSLISDLINSKLHLVQQAMELIQARNNVAELRSYIAQLTDKMEQLTPNPRRSGILSSINSIFVSSDSERNSSIVVTNTAAEARLGLAKIEANALRQELELLGSQNSALQSSLSLLQDQLHTERVRCKELRSATEKKEDAISSAFTTAIFLEREVRVLLQEIREALGYAKEEHRVAKVDGEDPLDNRLSTMNAELRYILSDCLDIRQLILESRHDPISESQGADDSLMSLTRTYTQDKLLKLERRILDLQNELQETESKACSSIAEVIRAMYLLSVKAGAKDVSFDDDLVSFDHVFRDLFKLATAESGSSSSQVDDSHPSTSLLIEISPRKSRISDGYDVSLKQPKDVDEQNKLSVDSMRSIFDQIDFRSKSIVRMMVNTDRNTSNDASILQTDSFIFYGDENRESSQTLTVDGLLHQLEETKREKSELHDYVDTYRKEIRKLRADISDLQNERSFFVSEAELLALQRELEAATHEMGILRRQNEELAALNESLKKGSESVFGMESKMLDLAEKNRILALSLTTARENIDFLTQKLEEEKRLPVKETKTIRKDSSK